MKRRIGQEVGDEVGRCMVGDVCSRLLGLLFECWMMKRSRSSGERGERNNERTRRQEGGGEVEGNEGNEGAVYGGGYEGKRMAGGGGGWG